MKRHKPSEERAHAAADFLRKRGVRGVRIAAVLGTGWGAAMPWVSEAGLVRIPFSEIPGFHPLGELDGHNRVVLFGEVDGVPVVALQGRVHLNEAPASREVYENVRLQIEMLLQLGVRTLIVTSAVGSLRHDVEVGKLVSPRGLITVFAPDMPLYAGEFVSPEDTLVPSDLINILVNEMPLHTGNHVMVRGPFFEGRKVDKKVLEKSGADVVGMSLLPECCIAALYGARVIPLCFVTNSAHEEHSHDTNVERANAHARTMRRALAVSVRVAHTNPIKEDKTTT